MPGMTIAEILLLDYDAEIAGTRRTLERVPESDPQWVPHEKSMPIGRLAMHVATLPRYCTSILSTPEMDMSKDKWPPLIFESTAHLLAQLESVAAEARQRLAASSDEDLRTIWRLGYQGKILVEGPRMTLYRTTFLNHLVHHRAQLGVYFRMLGVPVPGLYGPSADEPF